MRHRAWKLAWAALSLGCSAPNPAYMPRIAKDAAAVRDTRPALDARPAPDKADAQLPQSDAAPGDLAATLEHGLLGYWPFDEAAGATLAHDASGQGRDGVVEGQGATFVAGGHLDRALSVPGASSNGVGVRIPYSTEIDDLRAFTLTAWFRLAAMDPPNTQRSVISRQLGATSAEVFNLTCSNGDVIAYIPGAGNQVNFEARARGAAVVGAWLHGAATYDGRYLRIYVNGTQIAESDFPDRLVSSPGTPVYIGTNKNAATSEPFNGLIDDVALYSYALSPAAVARLAGGATPLEVR